MDSSTTPTRSVELVLVIPSGDVLGRLPIFPVETPWWNDIESVVREARARYGIDIIVLRLLDGETDAANQSRVTYLAETADVCNHFQPWNGRLDEQPMRHAFAKAGGPARDLAWADARLAETRLRRTGSAVQVRTWNLSSLWRIPTSEDYVWLKVVPSFFAHEGALVARLDGHKVPKVIAHEPGRMLLADITGDDLYSGASMAQSLAVITELVDIQAAWLGREDELLSLGLPDWRLPAVRKALGMVLDRTKEYLSPDDVKTLRQFIDDLPAMERRLAECGIPPTLIHGDFHPGNLRGTGISLTILDWGDSGISHPLLDQMAWLRHVKPDDLDAVRDHWHAEWKRHLQHCAPETASRLMQPVSATYQAVIRQRFLDNIEPAEHFYHMEKRAMWLRRAAELYRGL